MVWLVTLAMLQPVTRPTRLGPADAIRMAWADIQTLPQAIRPSVRYITCYNLPESERKAAWQTLSFICNSVSRERVITAPTVVGGTGGSLFRVILTNYVWEPQAWEKMAEKGSGPSPLPEPYFHIQGEGIVHEFDHWEQDGWNRGEPRWRRVDKDVRTRTIVAAPWLPSADAAGLALATGSSAPIVRSDWFIGNASLAPAYYRFLDVSPDGTEADFDKLIFADEKLAEKARLNSKGVVARSQVALHNRSLNRIPTITGYKWASHDSKTSTGPRDYLAELLDEKFDAKEIIASLPNGLQAYAVVDGAGKLQEKADADLAQDYSTTLQDKQIRVGRNCMACHANGMQVISDDVRNLARDKIALLTADPEKARRIRDQYGVDLGRQVQKDSGQYGEAITTCNGLTSPANAALFEKTVQTFQDDAINADTLARECGVSEARLMDALRRGINLDARLTGLLQTPPHPIRRDQLEGGAFGQMMILLGQAK